MTDTYVEYNANGDAVAFVGDDAVLILQAGYLKMHISLYQKCGVIPTRGYGIKRMLAAATSITKEPYKFTDLDAPIRDLGVWIAEMKSALPEKVR